MPCLLFGKSKTLPPIVGALSKLPVKKSEMGLQNIVTSSKEKYTSLLHVSDNTIDAFKDKQVFSTTNHIQEVKGDGRDGIKITGCHESRESLGNC